MIEAAAANDTPGRFDLEHARAALTSSSTTARIAQLRGVDEKLSQKGKWARTLRIGSGGRKKEGAKLIAAVVLS
jgi:hypothetical protein